MRFIFAQEVFDLGVRGIYFNIRGMRNVESTDPRVRGFVDSQLAMVPIDMEDSATLRGFLDLHAAVSKRSEKLMSAPANLLAMFRLRKNIPRVNGIVDIYNSVSVASGLAVGAHDLAHVEGDIELRITRGDETFWPLGASSPARAPAGEYAYVDASNAVLCRLEVRQVEKTKITLETRDVFFIVQGHDRVTVRAMQQGAELLVTTCQSLFGGDAEPLYP
jgi:DNA/RNA-binding domain of Phe-tRNA-synthetase-like protein